jgi:dienelactone hydrolase
MDTGTARRRRRRRTGLAAAAVAAVALGAACAPPVPPPATGLDPSTAPRAAEAAYVGAGPYAAGVTTISLGDRSAEVWYPVDRAEVGDAPRDAYDLRSFLSDGLNDLIPAGIEAPFTTDAYRALPAAGGPFPLVVFSHGALSYRLQSTVLTTHLASWGFVVVSPDYLERGVGSLFGTPPAAPRGDVEVATAAVAAVRSASTGDGLLAGTVDPAAPYSAVGHSAGGSTSLRLLAQPGVDTAIPLAAGISGLELLTMSGPALEASDRVTYIAGQGDGIVPVDNARNGFTYTPGERKLFELSGAGHNNAFSDICEVGDGGPAALARAAGLPIPDAVLALADDGCSVPPFRESAELWPEVRHLVTAELRYRTGLDAEPVGLGDQIVDAFDDIAVYRHDP